MLIAQLTDLHIRPPGMLFADIIDTLGFLRRAVDRVLALDPRPDVVLVTGDLTNDGEPEAYAQIRPELARLPMPVYAIPGNHDDREGMLALEGVAEMGAGNGFRQFVVDLGGLRLIALDSLVPGEGHGAFCPERAAWLEDALARSGTAPLLVMVHHPPGTAGIPFMDRINLRTTPEIDVIFRRHAQHIQRIVCGHVHRPIFYQWQGVPVSVAPCVAHQSMLTLAGDDAALVMEPPAFHLHRWTPAEGLVTHQVYTDPYPGPYRFEGNPEVGVVYGR